MGMNQNYIGSLDILAFYFIQQQRGNAEAIPEARILDMKEVSLILRKRELGKRCGLLCTSDLISFLPINMSENQNVLDWVLPTATCNSLYMKK